MDNKELTISSDSVEKLGALIMNKDMVKCSEKERLQYYEQLCHSLGLNPLTHPFELMHLHGKLVWYATKDCTDQLRKIHSVSITITERTRVGDIYSVGAKASIGDRTDESTGCVAVGAAKGEALANSFMKAECVPIDYQILTKQGFRSCLEIECGDLVAGYNFKTKLLFWQPLLEINRFSDRTVAKFSSSTTTFEITPGHKWISKPTPCGEYFLRPFEDIGDNAFILLAAPEHETKSNITEYEAAVFGWIITDGTIRYYKDVPYRASICQSKKENFEHIETSLRLAFPKEGVSKGVTDNKEKGWKDQYWWYLSKKQTLSLFERLGYQSHNDLPTIATSLGYSAREAMLKSMMLADGDKRGTFGKCDLRTIECFQILCTLNGIALSKMKTRIFKNSTKPIYLVRQLSHTQIVRQYLENLGQRVTDVWCPTTGSGSWVMRSPEHQIAITSNTKAKRRVTLSICGLGFTDDSEVDSIHGAKRETLPGANKPKSLEAPCQEIVGVEPPLTHSVDRVNWHKDAIANEILEGQTPASNLKIMGEERFEMRPFGEFPTNTLQKCYEKYSHWENYTTKPMPANVSVSLDQLQELLRQRGYNHTTLSEDFSGEKGIDGLFPFEKAEIDGKTNNNHTVEKHF